MQLQSGVGLKGAFEGTWMERKQWAAADEEQDSRVKELIFRHFTVGGRCLYRRSCLRGRPAELLEWQSSARVG